MGEKQDPTLGGDDGGLDKEMQGEWRRKDYSENKVAGLISILRALMRRRSVPPGQGVTRV